MDVKKMSEEISENDDVCHLRVFLRPLLRIDIGCGVGFESLKQCFRHKFGFFPKALVLFSPALSHSSRQHKAIFMPSLATPTHLKRGRVKCLRRSSRRARGHGFCEAKERA